jgi:hypothetical protein
LVPRGEAGAAALAVVTHDGELEMERSAAFARTNTR